MKIWSFLVLPVTVAMVCLSSDALAYERYHGHSSGIHAGVGNLIRTDVSGRGIHAGVGNLIRVGVGGGRPYSSRNYRDYDDDNGYSHRHSRYRDADRMDRYDRYDRYDDDQPSGNYQGGGSLIGDILNGVLGY